MDGVYLTLLFRPALIGLGGERAVRLALARLGLLALHDVVLTDALGHTQIDSVRQNHRHCKAVEAAIIVLTLPVHGRIVSAGRARFCEALEVVPIPVSALGQLVVDSPQVARVDSGELDVA